MVIKKLNDDKISWTLDEKGRMTRLEERLALADCEMGEAHHLQKIRDSYPEGGQLIVDVDDVLRTGIDSSGYVPESEMGQYEEMNVRRRGYRDGAKQPEASVADEQVDPRGAKQPALKEAINEVKEAIADLRAVPLGAYENYAEGTRPSDVVNRALRAFETAPGVGVEGHPGQQIAGRLRALMPGPAGPSRLRPTAVPLRQALVGLRDAHEARETYLKSELGKQGTRATFENVPDQDTIVRGKPDDPSVRPVKGGGEGGAAYRKIMEVIETAYCTLDEEIVKLEGPRPPTAGGGGLRHG